MSRFHNLTFIPGTMPVVSSWPCGLREDAKLQAGNGKALVGRCAS